MNRYNVIRFMFCTIGFLVTAFMCITINITDNVYDRSRQRVPEDQKYSEPEELLELGESSTSEERPQLPIHDQEDAKLVKYLQSVMTPPSDAPYSFRLSDFETSQGQGEVVRRITKYKEGGFFVECGAADGEFYSNSLFLEKHLGWTGLLVEADPESSRKLRNVHRRAWSAQACMSLNTSAYETYFERNSYFLGKVLESSQYNAFKVNCYPFYTFLLALNVTKIDYFSLDVEGHEVEILETIPFDKVDITVLSVEFSKSRGGLLGVKRAMERNGYEVVQEVPPDDLIFVKRTSHI